MIQYENFSLAHKASSVLGWWKDHEKVLPILSKVVKKVLTVPASSAKSERVFSTGTNFMIVFPLLLLIIIIVIIIMIRWQFRHKEESLAWTKES